MFELALIGWFASMPLWSAGLLLVAGGTLLAWPTLRRLVQRRLEAARGTRVPTLDERLSAVRAASHERQALERLVREAREAITLGCSQLDSRARRLEALLAQADRNGSSLRSPRTPSTAASEAEFHIRGVRPAGEREAEFQTDPVAREVFALSDAGRTPPEIAAALQEHVGKVELMLALRRV